MVWQSGHVVAALWQLVFLAAFLFWPLVIGRRLCRTLSFSYFSEEVVVSSGVGYAVLGSLIFCAGILSQLKVIFVSTVLLSLFLLSFPYAAPALCRSVARSARARGWGIFAIVVSLPVISFLLINTLYPPVAWDAIEYYLPVARAFAESHTIGALPNLRFEVYTPLNQLFFALALLVANPIVAQTVQLAFYLLLLGAVYAASALCFDRSAGFVAVCLVLGNELLHLLATTCYIDVGATFFSALSLVCFVRFLRGPSRGASTLSGLSFGLAASAKYTCFVPAVVAGGLTFLLSEKDTRWRNVSRFSAAFFILVGPWLIFNYEQVGNPVFPLATAIFGTGNWTADQVRDVFVDLHAGGVGHGALAFCKVWYSLFFEQGLFRAEAPLSRLYVLFYPLIVASLYRSRANRYCSLFLTVSTLWWMYNAQLWRHFLPNLILLSLISGGALWVLVRRLPLSGEMKNLLMAIAGIAVVVLHGQDYRNKVRAEGAPPLTAKQVDEYLTPKLPAYQAIRFLNESLGRKYVLQHLYQENMTFYIAGYAQGDHFGPFAYERITPLFAQPEKLIALLRKQGTTHLLCPKSYLERAGVSQFSNPGLLEVFSDANFVVWALVS